MKKTSVILFSLLVVLFAFVSCDTNATGSLYIGVEHQTSPNGSALLVYADQYYVGESDGRDPVRVKGSIYGTTLDELSCGNWTFHVECFNSNGDMIAISDDVQCKVTGKKQASCYPEAKFVCGEYLYKVEVQAANGSQGAVYCTVTLNGDAILTEDEMTSSATGYNDSKRVLLQQGTNVFVTKILDENKDEITTVQKTVEVSANDLGSCRTVTHEAASLTALPATDHTGSFISGSSLGFTCPTAGATIYYTTDGTSPALDSTSRKLYTEPFTVSENTVFKVCAIAAGCARSNIMTYDCRMTVATPVIHLDDCYVYIDDEGSFDLEVSCSTPGAVIRYSIGNGNYPTADSPEYTGSYTPISGTCCMRFAAFCDGMEKSSHVQCDPIIRIQDEVVTADHASGNYNNAFQVTLSCPSYATMKYWEGDYNLAVNTTDVTGPITIDSSRTFFVKSYHKTISGVFSFQKKFYYYLKVATPQLEEEGGLVTITSETQNAVIHYTTDGSNPTESSPVYSSPIAVSAGMTVKAMGYRSGFEASNPASATY